MDRLITKQANPLDRNLGRELSLSTENDCTLLGCRMIALQEDLSRIPMNQVKSYHQLKFNHSNPLIGSEMLFVENRIGQVGHPNGFNVGQTPLGMGAVVFFYVVAHNAKHSGTICAIRLWHTGDAKTTSETLKDIVHMDASKLVLSVAARFEEQILDAVPKGASVHKLLGLSLYFSPQRAILEPPPVYMAPAQNQVGAPIEMVQGPSVDPPLTPFVRDRNDLTAQNEIPVPGSSQGPIYYEGQDYFGPPYPHIRDPNAVPLPPIELPSYSQHAAYPPILPENNGLLDDLFSDILPM